MKNKLMWSFTALSFMITTIVLPVFPDKIPMHYDLYGNIDRWGSKYEHYIFPILILVLALFWQILIRFYEKKAEKLNDSNEGKEAASNAKVLRFTAGATTVLFVIMQCFFLFGAYTEAKLDATTSSLDINMIMAVLMGLLLCALGSYMPKTHRNPVIGFRTSKTMSSDENWAKANRFAGKVFMFSGVLTVVLALIFGGILAMSLFLAILLLDVVICLIYASKL